MQRIGAFFVAICMVLIAGSIGALLYVYFRLDGVESAVVAIAVLEALQLLVPGRDARLEDFAVKALASSAGLRSQA